MDDAGKETLERWAARRLKLEDDLRSAYSNLVDAFTNETGLAISSVDVGLVEVAEFGGSGYARKRVLGHVRVEVDLPRRSAVRVTRSW